MDNIIGEKIMYKIKGKMIILQVITRNYFIIKKITEKKKF